MLAFLPTSRDPATTQYDSGRRHTTAVVGGSDGKQGNGRGVVRYMLIHKKQFSRGLPSGKSYSEAARTQTTHARIYI